MNILIAEGMHETGINYLKVTGFNIYTPQVEYPAEQIDILIVRSVYRVDAVSLEHFPKLRCVAKLGTGLDNIDLELCEDRGIKVINTPGMNSIATAEFALMQILCICKNNFEIIKRVEGKDYRRTQYYGRELSAANVGVIGLGSVGKHIVNRVRPFIGVDQVYISTRKIHKGQKIETDQYFYSGNEEKLLKNTDIIILTVNLSGNEHMVDEAFLSKVKKEVLLVNVARGGIIDEAALIKFLKANPKAIYCCDVLEKEPDYTKDGNEQDYHNPLLELDNVIYTPHIAGMTMECQKGISDKVALEIVKWAGNKQTINKQSTVSRIK